MKAKTKEILRSLLREHSLNTLIGLWGDIHQIDQQGFKAQLSALQAASTKTPATKKKRQRKASSLPADDRPVTRIAHHLRSKLELDDQTAIMLLRDALAVSGLRQPLPPIVEDQMLEDWLNNLFDVVSDAKVFATAKKLKKPL